MAQQDNGPGCFGIIVALLLAWSVLIPMVALAADFWGSVFCHTFSNQQCQSFVNWPVQKL